MRICIFSRSFWPNIGGQERVAAVLAREFSRVGHSVVVLTDTPSTAREQECYEVIRSRKFWQRVAVFRKSDRVVFMGSSLQGLAACWLAGRRCCVAHHSLYDSGKGLERLAGRLKGWLTRFTVNICVSDFQRQRIAAPAVIIPNPVDEEFLVSGVGTSCNVDFCFAGRLVQDKGTNLLLEAFSMLSASFPHIRLRIIGDGPERRALEGQALKLGVGPRVSFTGALSGYELAKAMAECGCLVVPSLCEETFGMAALEGVASGAHVIVSRRGALPEVIGCFGTVVDPDPEALATAMEDYLRGARALPSDDLTRGPFLEQFTSGRIAARYLEVLTDGCLS